jgi:hypothetical protein
MNSWRMEHPGLRFTTVSVGDTFPTDFGNAFDGDILMKVFDEWGARGLAQAQFLTPGDVARTLLAIAAALRDTPAVGIDHLTIRSPSPRVASFMDTLAGLAGAAVPADPPADPPADQGEISG